MSFGSESDDPYISGSIHGNYTFGRTLGEGSFGKVKIATHNKTGAVVAMKIVSKDCIEEIDDVERVSRETFILTGLKHENIIRLYEVFNTEGAIMLAMEYAGGGELCEYLQEKVRLTEIEAVHLFKQIVAGVQYCHRARVIHRDLKLENILLSESQVIKIADFGLSNSIKFGQKMSSKCGTPSFTCPEQIRGEDYVGSGADVWSLGVILFNLVTGFLPFEAQHIQGLFEKILNGHFRFPDYISEESKDLLSFMLTNDFQHRASVSDITNHEWFLMDFSDLSARITAMPEVTLEMVMDAHKKNLSAADDIREAEAKAIRDKRYAKLQAEHELLSMDLERLASYASPSNDRYTSPSSGNRRNNHVRRSRSNDNMADTHRDRERRSSSKGTSKLTARKVRQRSLSQKTGSRGPPERGLNGLSVTSARTFYGQRGPNSINNNGGNNGTRGTNERRLSASARNESATLARDRDRDRRDRDRDRKSPISSPRDGRRVGGFGSLDLQSESTKLPPISPCRTPTSPAGPSRFDRTRSMGLNHHNPMSPTSPSVRRDRESGFGGGGHPSLLLTDDRDRSADSKYQPRPAPNFGQGSTELFELGSPKHRTRSASLGQKPSLRRNNSDSSTGRRKSKTPRYLQETSSSSGRKLGKVKGASRTGPVSTP